MFEREAEALFETSRLQDRHIVRAFAAISKGEKRYFLLEWAGKDNLESLYKMDPEPKRTPEFTHAIITQLKGIVDAVVKLHDFSHGDVKQGSYRHGDLKPANILRFEGGDHQIVGHWKIGDLGLAKHHMEATEVRKPTSTRHGTVRYEAPETVIPQSGGRSRQYDIWSLGCITLELIVWMLYGRQGHKKFNEEVGQADAYYKSSSDGTTAVVHPRVKDWISFIRTKSPACKTRSAMGELLECVESKLIVVAVKPPAASTESVEHSQDRASSSQDPILKLQRVATEEFPDSAGPYRGTAKDFQTVLDKIAKSAADGEYRHVGTLGTNAVSPPLPRGASGNRLAVPGAQNQSGLSSPDVRQVYLPVY